jgi:hypothetical protein
VKKRYREEPGTALTPARAEAMLDVRSPRYLYAGGGTKPPISAASNRANSIVVGSSAYEESPFGQNGDADYCQGIAKIDPCWVSDCS